MDSTARTKLRYLSLLTKNSLLKVFYTWKSYKTSTPNPQTHLLQPKTLSHPSPKPLIQTKTLHSTLTKPSTHSLNSKIDIFEEIKASLKLKARNSGFIISPIKISGLELITLRSKHKRANTDINGLSFLSPVNLTKEKS